MAKRSEFSDYVADLLAPLGPVQVRGMFGGFGIFLDGLMFGLLADDTLYLKVDDANRAEFEAAGCEPFVYTMKGKAIEMSYRRAPEDAVENWETIQTWAESGLGAARRALPKKNKKRSKPKRSSGS